MTKNFLLLLLFVLFNSINGQQISDYKYVYVPKDFKDFKNNKFGLNASLVKKLQSKGYTVLQNEQSEWPQELRQNPCEVATVDISDTGNFLKNKITFEAKECNDKVIFSKQGVSSEKDFEIGFKESLEKSLATLPASSPSNTLAQLKVNVPTEKPLEVEKKEISPEPSSSKNSQDNSATNYSNGVATLQKVVISNNQFIFVEKNSAVPYATFTNSTKSDVYRVVLKDGASTLGYLENGNYVIEIANENGGYNKDVFRK